MGWDQAMHSVFSLLGELLLAGMGSLFLRLSIFGAVLFLSIFAVAKVSIEK